MPVTDTISPGMAAMPAIHSSRLRGLPSGAF